jgi:glycosyltransferase involved in cell wall biosynthesis
MTKVAIVIPNLNGSKYLFETLTSIAMQKSAPDEVIISDNQSTDNSLEIIKLFRNLNIRVVIPERSLSMSENWNFAAMNSKSDWFFLLSNDDLLRDTAILRLRTIITELSDDVGTITFKSEIIDENSRLLLGKFKIGKSRIREEYEFLKENIKFLHINAASVAIRKSAWQSIGGFPENYRFIHDLIFYQRLVLKYRIMESKEVLGRYRVYSKPNSELRVRQTEMDFDVYEQLDLSSHIMLYPDLELAYESEICSEVAIQDFRRTLRLQVRKILIYIMTWVRHIAGILRRSGFPT